MNARGLAYKLSRRCVAAGLEVVEGPIRNVGNAEDGVTWEFTVYNEPAAAERSLMGVVIVYGDLDVRVLGDNRTTERELRSVLKSM